MKSEYSNRLTFLTLRWIYGNGRENEFLQCKTKEDIKLLIWKHLKPLFENEEKRICSYRNVVISEIQSIDLNSKPKKAITVDPVYIVISKEKQIESFKKGMTFVKFEPLLEIIKELSVKKEIKKKDVKEVQEFQDYLDEEDRKKEATAP
jgi:hypothetical protein